MEIRIPYKWWPEKHQMPIIKDIRRFKVIVMHRKAHKTTLSLNKLIIEAMKTKGVYWYIAPFLNESRKIVWQDPEMLPKYIPEVFWEKRNNSELYIPLPNGSMIYVLGADRPDSLRGPNPKGVILDEYDYMTPDIWSAIIQPIMTANPEAWCWFVGTYNGKKDLYNKFVFAKNNPKDWQCSLLKASESGIIAAEDLSEARRTTTEAFYQQEYECEPIESSASFFKRVRENIWSGELLINPSKSFQIGVDLAKYNDWTVLTPFDKNTMRIGKLTRFNQIDYPLQEARIEAMSLKYNKGKVVIDSTGVGEPVYDSLKAKGLNIEPFRFTETSRMDLLNHLSILLANDKIKIPNDEVLIDELESMQFMLGKTGKVKVGVPENMTDDCVMSLALAVHGINEPQREFNYQQPFHDKLIEIWRNE